MLAYLANSLIFHPSPFPEGVWELQQVFAAEDVWLETADGGTVHGWFMSTTDDNRFVTLYLHGNAGNITDRRGHIEAICNTGSALLIIDYRGFGKSPGKPTEQGVYLDATAAYEHLLGRNYTADRIILHGESLGTGLATDLASRLPCAGIILEAPFPSVGTVAHRILPFLGPFLVSGFETGEKMASINVPLLVIHGDQDETIAFDLGKKVFELAAEPKYFWRVPGAHHNDIIAAAGMATYETRLHAFQQSLP